MNKLGLAFFIVISAYSGLLGGSFSDLRAALAQTDQECEEVEQKSFLKQKRTLLGISALIVAAAGAYAYKLGLAPILYDKIISCLQKGANVETEKKDHVFERCKREKSSDDLSDKTLVEHIKALGSDVVDEKGRSPLHYAVNNGNCQLVAFLIDECGINPENFPDLFECALTDKMKQFLISRNIPQAKKAFEEASERSVRETVQHLRNGADPSQVTGTCCFKVYPIVQAARLLNYINKSGTNLLAWRPFKTA